MKHFFIYLLLITAFSNVNSQDWTFQSPDYELIKKNINDSTSNFYYSKLLSRLTVNDTTLTREDYRHLYYGYIYNEKYQPYWKSTDEEKLLKYYNREEIREKDYKEIINLATHSINEFPFDLRQMNFLAYTYHLSGDEETAKKISIRFHKTIDAIMSSGNGKTCETGFHVISVSHEYVLLNVFEFNLKSQALTGDCDYLSFVKDQRNIEGLYFNIKKLFDKNLEEMKKQ